MSRDIADEHPSIALTTTRRPMRQVRVEAAPPPNRVRQKGHLRLIHSDTWYKETSK